MPGTGAGLITFFNANDRDFLRAHARLKNVEKRKMDGEQILRDKLIDIADDLGEDGGAINIAVITEMIGQIFELFRGCSSPARAEKHVKRGSAMVRRKVRNMLVEQDYRGDVRKAARKITKAGRKLSQDELSAILDEAADDPRPPVGGFWPAWAVLFAVGLLSLDATPTAAAAGFWPLGDTSAEAAPAAGEADRLLLFVSDDCRTCEVELRRLKSPGGPFEKMRQSGWSIGHGSENDLQILPVELTDLDERLGVDYTPAFVCMFSGRIVRRLEDGCGTVADPWSLGWLQTGKRTDRPPAREAVRVRTSGNYPIHGQRWTVKVSFNVSRSFVLRHLLESPNHRGKFDGWGLSKWSRAELLSLHDDDHEGHIKSRIDQSVKVSAAARGAAWCPPGRV